MNIKLGYQKLYSYWYRVKKNVQNKMAGVQEEVRYEKENDDENAAYDLGLLSFERLWAGKGDA